MKKFSVIVKKTFTYLRIYTIISSVRDENEK